MLPIYYYSLPFLIGSIFMLSKEFFVLKKLYGSLILLVVHFCLFLLLSISAANTNNRFYVIDFIFLMPLLLQFTFKYPSINVIKRNLAISEFNIVYLALSLFTFSYFILIRKINIGLKIISVNSILIFLLLTIAAIFILVYIGSKIKFVTLSNNKFGS